MMFRTKTIQAVLEPVGPEGAFPGEFSVVLSTETKDREGDELTPDTWQSPLPELIQFNTDHSFLVKDTVGSGVPTIDAAGQLVVNGTYAETDHAQDTRKIVNGKHIGHVSVAYRDTEDGKRELINGSFVVVPANPEAKVLASKAITPNLMPGADEARDKVLQAIVEAKDMTSAGAGVLAPLELVQAIHDAAGSLGAACVGIAGLADWMAGGMGDYSTPVKALSLVVYTEDGAVHVKDLPLESSVVEKDSQVPVETPADDESAAVNAATAKARAKWFVREQSSDEKA